MSGHDPREEEMRERLEVLTDWVSGFKERYGVALHFKDFSGYMLSHPFLGDFIGSYLFHEDPFCTFVKENREVREKCVIMSNDILMSRLMTNHRANSQRNFRTGDEGFYGVCWCGIREYVYPICHSGIIIGAILVGPFRADARRLRHSFTRLCRRWGFDHLELDQLYDRTVTEGNGFELAVAVIANYISMLAEYYIDHSLVATFSEVWNGNSGQRKLISMAIEYISMNLSSKISVADMAVHCMCSKSTLNHLFSGAMGRTIPEFVSIQRIRRAKYLLTNTEQSVEQIAAQCGFSTCSYFSVVFRKLTDFTPTEFRNKNKRGTIGDVTGVL